MPKPAQALFLTVVLLAASVSQAANSGAATSAAAVEVSDHDVIPRQTISINILNHDPSSNPYELVWLDDGSAVIDVITSTLVVDVNGARLGIPFVVPSDKHGTYFLETRKNAVQIARSGAINVMPARASYLPVAMQDQTIALLCPTTSNNQYAAGTAFQVELDDPVRPAYDHADKNISLRGYIANTDPTVKRELVDYGSGDLKAPQLATLFNTHRTPDLTTFYRIHDWAWAPSPQPGTQGDPITSPPVTALGLRTNPGENLHVPESGYGIGGGFEVIVVFAGENTITLKYSREDTAATGYTIHIDNICTDPNLLTLYNTLDDADGPRYVYMPPASRPYTYRLPTLKAGQTFGTARGTRMVVAIADTGTFQDPRSCNEWWLVRPGYEGACPPGP